MIPVMVVPILTGPDLLNRLLRSIDHPVGRLVVIDNGNAVDSYESLKGSEERVTLVRSPSNLGVSTSWNLGIKMTPFAPWWMIVNHDAHFPPGSLERFAYAARPDTLALSGGAPPWCAFAVGEQVVARVGLFDEALHPAYCEDDDYTRRCQSAGMAVVHTGIHVEHDNSSTLHSGYQDRNATTFPLNVDYYRSKAERGDMSEGRWSLQRRRGLSWD